MDDITDEVINLIHKHQQRLMELDTLQDELTAELKDLETRFDAGHVTQTALESRLEILIPRHERQQQEIALALTEIERLRLQIFEVTGLELPPMM